MAIYNARAPALPLAPIEYDQRQQDQFQYALRLYFNRLDTFLSTLATPASGPTADRPALDLQVGQFYFDTTLNKPTYWDGTQWIDALGGPLVAVTGVQSTLNIGSVVVTTSQQHDNIRQNQPHEVRMNYYAQGGQAQGLKSLAQELQDYGRGGDTMLAHINPQEAAMLKRMGGSGTINPDTGLPEYFKKVWKKTVGKVEDIVKPVTKPITDAIKPILPYVQYVAPFIPGVNAMYAAGLGALGSGFAGGGGFNFKRGLMGGMTAYGLSNLYAGMQAASGAPGAGSTVSGSGPMELGVTGTELAPSTVAQTGLTVPPGAAGADIGSQIMAGDFSNAASTIGQNIGEGVSSAYNTVTNPNTYSGFGDQMSNAGQGIKNLTGLGETTLSSADAATAFGNKAGIGSAMAAYGGVTGQAALDEYDEAKLQAELAAAENDQQRAAIMARIEDGRRRAEEAVRNNPYMFAYGGPVDDEAGFDDFNDYMGGGIASMAKGGMAPRFLSGGGDGMSDGIPATINGKQPARLADGEFVIPADVVSHLGNGSSKAGAKQLYSMMDKVRSARTGNKKQGKQINPAKYMPA